MNLSDSIKLAGYIRQAETYGTEEVFETALDAGLSMRDLGALALRLQNVSPKWKLTVEAQRWFAIALMGLVSPGITMKDVARMVGVAPGTVSAWYAEWLLDDDPADSEGNPGLALQAASKARFASLKGIVRGWHRTG